MVQEVTEQGLEDDGGGDGGDGGGGGDACVWWVQEPEPEAESVAEALAWVRALVLWVLKEPVTLRVAQQGSRRVA